MTLRLNGSNSGFTEVKAPATAGSNTITLPTSNGSANQYLANGSTAGELTFVTPPGSFTSYAIINDSKADNTDGGAFTTGAWRTRDLNTELADPDGIVSISSNQFTLGAGSYLIKFSAPAYQVNSHQTRLYDVTGTAAVAYGSAEFTSAGTTNGTNRSHGVGRITISANNVYEIQHRGAYSRTIYGFGIGAAGNMNWGSGTPGTVYTIVEIYKEA